MSHKLKQGLPKSAPQTTGDPRIPIGTNQYFVLRELPRIGKVWEPLKSPDFDFRWKLLIEQFRVENFRLYALSTQSVFCVALQAGLSALKTPQCYRSPGDRNTECPGILQSVSRNWTCLTSLNLLTVVWFYTQSNFRYSPSCLRKRLSLKKWSKMTQNCSSCFVSLNP